MSAADELLADNRAYAAAFEQGDVASAPRRKLAVVACMDARLDLFAALGLSSGDAHVIRNAGGVVTDDVIRSLVISQRMLATESVVLVQHTDCGLLRFTDDELKGAIYEDVGDEPAWSSEAFDDLDGNVRQSIERIRTDPFIPRRDDVRGFVYDVKTGALREVS